MVLYFYLLSVAFSIIIMHFTTSYFWVKIKQDRIWVQEKFSQQEDIIFLIFTFLKIVIPIYNIIYAIYLIIWHNRVYTKIITKWFMMGKADFDNRFG